jgi:hypothetical protein
MEAWMAGKYVRLMEPRSLVANEKQPRDQWLDLGAYKELNIHARLLKAGTAGNVLIQDSAVPEDDGFVRTIATISCQANTNPVTITGFLRNVRWIGDGSVAGAPVLLVDIVAKE